MSTPNKLLLLSSKKTAVTPQSSLGELGKSLLKFITPVCKVKAHIIVHDYLGGAQHTTAASFSIVKTAKTSTPVSQYAAAKKPEAPIKRGPTSSSISVTRDSSTPWINVVTNLLESCETSSVNTRSRLGASTYQSAKENKAEIRRKTVGRIINLVTEDDTTDYAALEREELEKKKAAEPVKPKASNKAA